MTPFQSTLTYLRLMRQNQNVPTARTGSWLESLPAFQELAQKWSGPDNLQRSDSGVASMDQEIVIAGHEEVGVTAYRNCEQIIVSSVARSDHRRRIGFDPDCIYVEQSEKQIGIEPV